MVAHFVASTGMAWEQIEDQLTIPRMQAQYRYWEQHPPTHIIAAAMAGIESRDHKREYASVDDLFGGGFG